MGKKSMSKTSTKWLRAAQHARTPSTRRKFTRLHMAEKLRGEIDACTNCVLSKTRINTVPFDNPYPSPIAFIGEAPGMREDEEGVPFVGKSGQLLEDMIEATGNSRSDATITNTLCCRPPHNRKPKPDEVEACRPLFDKQLDFSGAWVVVLLGASALHQFKPRANITDTRGNPFWLQGRIYIPTFHPAYVLRNRGMRKVVEQDIAKAFRIVNGDEWWEPVNVMQLAKPNDGQSKYMTELLHSQGWAVVDSMRLHDRIVVVKDDVVKVPMRYMSHTRYTVEELVRIGELGRGERINVGWLDSIHLVKKMGGTVVA